MRNASSCMPGLAVHVRDAFVCVARVVAATGRSNAGNAKLRQKRYTMFQVGHIQPTIALHADRILYSPSITADEGLDHRSHVFTAGENHRTLDPP